MGEGRREGVPLDGGLPAKPPLGALDAREREGKSAKLPAGASEPESRDRRGPAVPCTAGVPP